MADRRSIARRAAAAALRTRRSAGYGLTEPVCVYDLAERLGIEVRFVDIPSMEGMYLHSEFAPTILVSSLRPSGRRAFTCAHELGHYSNGDGTRVDELVEKRSRHLFEESEFAADCFAGILLMPKVAIDRAFALRKWKVHECNPGQFYLLSNYFGVGYSTLIHHMRSSLNILSAAQASALLKVKPRRLHRSRPLGGGAKELSVSLTDIGKDMRSTLNSAILFSCMEPLNSKVNAWNFSEPQLVGICSSPDSLELEGSKMAHGSQFMRGYPGGSSLVGTPFDT